MAFRAYSEVQSLMQPDNPMISVVVSWVVTRGLYLLQAREAPIQDGAIQGPSQQQHGALPRRRASPLKRHAEPSQPVPAAKDAGPKGRASTDVHCNPLFDADSHRAASMLAVLNLEEAPLGMSPPVVLPQPASSAGMLERQQASNALNQQAEERLNSGTTSSMCDDAHANVLR